MSFRKLSLVFIASLLACVLLLQWWSINNFTQAIAKQVGESAFEVSRTTAQKLIFEKPKVEILSFSMNSQQNTTTRRALDERLTRVTQEVFIQLVDKQTDDFILLNADGSEYQIPIPRTGIHDALDNFSNNVLYATVALLFVGIILAGYFTYKLTSPLSKLTEANQKIGEGNFGFQIDDTQGWRSHEIETTVRSFNQMSKRIAELQRQNRDLQNKAHLAELAEIAKGLAHSIRNPLNTLSLAIDEFQTVPTPEKKQDLAKISKHQIARIDRWIQSLMKLMSNDNTLLSNVDIVRLIEELSQEFMLGGATGIKLKTNLKNKTLVVKGVETELKSLLQSLLANAVEASADNSIIEVECEQQREGIQIRIVDQGKGMSPSILEKLFTPHNTDKTYGAGMGLYLAHRIIKHKYNGSLEVANNETKGTKVTLLLNDRG